MVPQSRGVGIVDGCVVGDVGEKQRGLGDVSEIGSLPLNSVRKFATAWVT